MNSKKTVRNTILFALITFSLLLQTVAAAFMIISEKSRAEDYALLITRTDAEKVNMSLNDIARNIQSCTDNGYTYDERACIIKNLLECSFIMCSGGFTEKSGESCAYIKESDSVTEAGREIIMYDSPGWSEPYTDEYDRYIITYSQPLIKNSEQTGTVYADISLENLALCADIMNSTQDSASYILDSDGNPVDGTEYDETRYFGQPLNCGLEFRFYFADSDLYGLNYNVITAAMITELIVLTAAAAIYFISRMTHRKAEKKSTGKKRMLVLTCVPAFAAAGILVFLGVFTGIQHREIFRTDDTIKPLNCFDETITAVCGYDYPYSYILEDGTYAGFDAEMTAEIANRIHKNLDMRILSWEEAVYEIEHGRADLMPDYSYYGTSQKILETDESSYDYLSIGVSGDKPELWNEINEAISEIRAEKKLIGQLESTANLLQNRKNWFFYILKKHLILYFVLLSVVIMLGIHIAVTYTGYRRRELAVASQTDALTGINNRGGGEARITGLVSTGVPGVFCLLDCDKFKSVNDNYGHETGDKVLKEVAACLKKSFRESDVVMRLGGDEFAVYMNGINSREKAEDILRKFFENIDNISIPELGDRKISVSLGATVYDGKEVSTFSDLYKKADSGTYESKKIKGSAFTFVSENTD